jgi:hypothetical protein
MQKRKRAGPFQPIFISKPMVLRTLKRDIPGNRYLLLSEFGASNSGGVPDPVTVREGCGNAKAEQVLCTVAEVCRSDLINVMAEFDHLPYSDRTFALQHGDFHRTILLLKKGGVHLQSAFPILGCVFQDHAAILQNMFVQGPQLWKDSLVCRHLRNILFPSR